jgi:hypothetical protein
MNKLSSTIIWGLFLVLTTSASYVEKPLTVIYWGGGSDQLKLGTPTHNFNPDDSTDDVDPGLGPDDAFIDKNGNIILASYGFRQIKGFEPNGHLLFDFSAGIAPNFNEACKGLPTNIYVDSAFNIYVTSFEAMPYIATINYSGEIVSKLYPYPDSVDSKISRMSWSPDGHIYFREQKRGWITYYNGEFSKSGCKGQLASNGYFYDAYRKQDYPHTLFIGKFGDVDTFAYPGYSDIKSIELPLSSCDTLYYTNEKLGGDGNSIYISAMIDSCDYYYKLIWQYDLEFNKIDELRFPTIEDSGYVCPSPIIGPDGSIYEFRTYSDGLHVIKWTKQ